MQSPRASVAEVAEAIFDSLQRRDLDAVARLQHNDIEDDLVAVGVYRGKPAVRGFFEELFAAVPHFTLTPERILADGEHATVQWRITGRFSGGPLQGVRATGRWVDLRGVDVMHVVDGLLVDNTIYFDMLSFARQIGMLPSAGSRGDRAMTAAFNAQTGLRGKLHLSTRSRELAQARRIAAPYVQLIDAVLDGTMAPGEFAAEFELAWDAQLGQVPDVVYEPVNHLAGVTEAYNPEFAAAGDTRYTTDADVVAAARIAREQLAAIMPRRTGRHGAAAPHTVP
jgi:ketosteroid isomerase-like protein